MTFLTKETLAWLVSYGGPWSVSTGVQMMEVGWKWMWSGTPPGGPASVGDVGMGMLLFKGGTSLVIKSSD